MISHYTVNVMIYINGQLVPYYKKALISLDYDSGCLKLGKAIDGDLEVGFMLC